MCGVGVGSVAHRGSAVTRPSIVRRPKTAQQRAIGFGTTGQSSLGGECLWTRCDDLGMAARYSEVIVPARWWYDFNGRAVEAYQGASTSGTRMC